MTDNGNSLQFWVKFRQLFARKYHEGPFQAVFVIKIPERFFHNEDYKSFLINSSTREISEFVGSRYFEHNAQLIALYNYITHNTLNDYSFVILTKLSTAEMWDKVPELIRHMPAPHIMVAGGYSSASTLNAMGRASNYEINPIEEGDFPTVVLGDYNYDNLSKCIFPKLDNPKRTALYTPMIQQMNPFNGCLIWVPASFGAACVWREAHFHIKRAAGMLHPIGRHTLETQTAVDRFWLYDKRINPILHRSGGIYVWGFNNYAGISLYPDRNTYDPSTNSLDTYISTPL